METVVIAGAARTPMGGFQGALSPLSAAELGGVGDRRRAGGARAPPQPMWTRS
jgi:acetyl-CoA C-acetyltransferase